MSIQQVHYFSDRETECVSLLNELGIGITAARLPVFLPNIDEASSRDFDRGLELRA